MSVEVLFNDGQREEVLPLDVNRRIQSVRFMLGSTTLELTVSNHPDGSRSPDVILPQAQQRPAAAVNASDPGTQTTESENPHSPAGGEETEMRIQREEYVKEMRGSLMVVATLFASMMFQASLNPPGGFWQDDLDSASYPPANVNSNMAAKDDSRLNITTYPSLSSILGSSTSNRSTFVVEMATVGWRNNATGHRAGDPVWADNNDRRYGMFMISTTNVTLFYSLGVILSLLSRTLFRSIATLPKLKTFVMMNVLMVWFCYSFGVATKHDDTDFYIVLILGAPGAFLLSLIVSSLFRRRYMENGVPSAHPTPN